LKCIADLKNVESEIKDRIAKSINLIANKCMEFYKKLSINEKFQLKRKRSASDVSDAITYCDLLK